MFQLAAALPDSFLEKRIERFISSWQCSEGLPWAVELWNGKQYRWCSHAAAQPRVTLRIKSPKVLMKLARTDLDTLGQAYAEGELDIDGHIRDICTVVADLVNGFSKNAARRLRTRPTSHTHKVDEASIRHHYDVSNAFYREWLDAEMVYSCAYFRDASDSLETAQQQKIDHILRKIRLQPGERLLDIGCGWGALILRAAKHYGAQCTGITLSQRQFDLATQRIREAGLEDRCTVLLMDYRDVHGRFDKITSVGMFEHVGLQNLQSYFRKIHDLLADDGVVMNHGITSSDPDSAETPLGGGRFIDRYVFPNGELPHIGLALKEMAAGGLEATDVGKPAHALRDDAGSLDESLRGKRGAIARDGWRQALPHLARVSGGLRLRLPSELDRATSDRSGQGRSVATAGTATHA
ncbi:cyclopropane-fatty-acyl-phospholipid synthase family protein [Uliginosibacterium sp. H3]|uniref:Cyclopropane-fatty-acyl-phospholipid synthase family protein n=1 Tax=Uliginosibacterium silvisoli TaxID=3114758 RepID=A0ABU6K5H7_9RHOO|nr:cyclopropane-fatty-acyl-phospholipid synthase family protein [Uliginosibacterium sp. H3]